MNKSAILAVLPLILTGSAAFAEATDDGAAHLLQVFQTYLGSADGVVTVEVDGDSYFLTVDASAMMAQAPGSTATMTPLEMTLTDNGDGTWDVVQDQAVSFAFAMPGQADVKEEIASLTSEGVFDEALMSFSSAKGEMTGIKVTETITAEGQPPMTVDIALAGGTFEIAGRA